MKLKKIASLALAGVMAVSMLTACGEGGSSSSEPTNPVVPSTTGIATYMNNLMTDAQADKISFEDDQTLRANLVDVAEDSSVLTPSVIATAQNNKAISSSNGTIASKVEDKYTTGLVYSTNTYDWNSWIIAAPSNQEKSWSYVESYVLSGDLNEMALASAVMDYWGTKINSLNTAYAGEDVVWTGDVAAVKVNNDRNVSETAWVVAVMVTKTVTNGSNTVQ